MVKFREYKQINYPEVGKEIRTFWENNNIFSTRAVAIYYNYMYAAADQTFFGGKKNLSFFRRQSKIT